MQEIEQDQYVDTPRGIFAANGLWFRTTVQLLREFAGEVLEKESINSLIQKSSIIYRSPTSIGLWALLLGLLVLPLGFAIALSLASYLIWAFIRRSVGGAFATKVLGIAENVGVQALGFVAGLSWLAYWPDMAKVIVGLLGFVLYRWKVIDSLVKPLIEKREANFSVPDQILRSVIVRSAIKHQISLDLIGSMEERLSKSMGLRK